MGLAAVLWVYPKKRKENLQAWEKEIADLLFTESSSQDPRLGGQGTVQLPTPALWLWASSDLSESVSAYRWGHLELCREPGLEEKGAAGSPGCGLSLASGHSQGLFS